MSVVRLHTPTARGEDAIAELEKALAMAKAGEVMSVAIAIVAPDGSSWTGWSHSEWMQAQLGAVSILHAKLTRAVLDD